MQSNTRQGLRKGKGNIHMGKRRNNENYTNKRGFGGEAPRHSENFHFFDPKIYILFTTCQTLGGGVVGPLGGGGLKKSLT